MWIDGFSLPYFYLGGNRKIKIHAIYFYAMVKMDVWHVHEFPEDLELEDEFPPTTTTITVISDEKYPFDKIMKAVFFPTVSPDELSVEKSNDWVKIIYCPCCAVPYCFVAEAFLSKENTTKKEAKKEMQETINHYGNALVVKYKNGKIIIGPHITWHNASTINKF